MGDSNFQIFSQNCQFHHRRTESLEHLNVFLYIIISTTVSVLGIKDAILFLQCVSLFLCTLPFFFQVHFACVLCIYRNFADSFDDRRSQCRLI